MANKKKCIVKGNSGGNVSGLSGLGYPPFSVPYVISEMPPEQKKKEIVIEGELNEIKEIAAVLLITQVLEFLNKKSDKKMLIKRNRDDVNGNK